MTVRGNERGGYHLVWPRDLVETAGALLALGADQEARDTLRYLMATQLRNGHWHQNQWLGGTPFWQGIQLDETTFPVLLAAALDERKALAGIEVEDMVRRALGFIAHTGLSTDQDRWEESAGLNPFTLAVSISALVAGAGLLPSPAAHWAISSPIFRTVISSARLRSATRLSLADWVPGATMCCSCRATFWSSAISGER